MVNDDPRGGGEPDWEGSPPEGNTEPIPTYQGPGYDDIIEFDDIEFAALGNAEAGVGFDQVDLIATREPSDLVRRYLFPTEKLRGEWRRHWIHLVRRTSLGVVATLILGYLAGYFASRQQPTVLTVLVLIWLAVVGWVLWAVVEWYYDRFILTNKRVMLVEGIVARNVAMMPLARVTDMKYTQTALGRVLG